MKSYIILLSFLCIFGMETACEETACEEAACEEAAGQQKCDTGILALGGIFGCFFASVAFFTYKKACKAENLKKKLLFGCSAISGLLAILFVVVGFKGSRGQNNSC
jgi:hypothetical protein